MFVMWKEIGRRMGIHEIPETAEELEEWSLVRPITELTQGSLHSQLC